MLKDRSALRGGAIAVAAIGGLVASAQPGVSQCSPSVVFGFAFEGLLAYDLRAGRSTLIAVGDSPDEGDPYDIEVHPTGNAVVVTKVYRCCHPEPSGEVSWLDLRSGYSTLLASGLDQPLGLALHPRGNAAFVAEFGTGRLLRVDFDTRAVSVVATGLSGPTGVAVDRSGAFAVVTEVGTGELSTVDLTVGSVTTIASGLGRPYGVDLSPSGTTAYVSVASASGSRLCAIGLATGSVSTVATGVSGDVELDPAGRSAFVGSSGALWQVDLASGSVTRLPGFGN